MSEQLTAAQLIPWDWSITPLDPTQIVCPRTQDILGVFAAVNAVVSAVALLFGHRGVVHFLTCGRLGRKDLRAWRYTWLLQVGLNLAGNFINAHLTVTAPGYDQSRMPRVWDLALFYISRPRLGWLSMWFAMIIVRTKGDRARPRADAPFLGATLQTFISEAVLLVLGLYYKGRIVHFAASHGYLLHGYLLSRGPLNGNPHILDFYLMTTPALVVLVFGLPSACVLVFIAVRYESRFIVTAGSAREPRKRWGSHFLWKSGRFLWKYFQWIILLYLWVGDWVSISGYVRLAGDL